MLTCIGVSDDLAALLDANTEINGTCMLPLRCPLAICNVHDYLTEIGLPLAHRVIVNEVQSPYYDFSGGVYGRSWSTFSYDFLVAGSENAKPNRINAVTWIQQPGFDDRVLVHWNKQYRTLGRGHGLPAPDWYTVRSRE